MSDILVVYYSRSGKTRWVAQKLAELLGADVEEILEKKDRAGVMGWLGSGRDAVMKKPSELVSEHTVAGRKAVLIGMPVWAFEPPPPIRAYVTQVDLAGKKVFGFCTFDGSGGDKTMASLGQLVPGGLADSLSLKKPLADQAAADKQIIEFVARVKALLL